MQAYNFIGRRLVSGLYPLFVFFLLAPALSVAETYKYVDEDGVVHFTDDRRIVPEQHRKTMELVDEKGRVEYYAPSFMEQVGIRIINIKYGIKKRVELCRQIRGFSSTNPKDITATLYRMKYWVLAALVIVAGVGFFMFRYVKDRPLRYLVLASAVFIALLLLGVVFRTQLFEHLDALAQSGVFDNNQRILYEMLLKVRGF
jgi:hypothetical protein